MERNSLDNGLPSERTLIFNGSYTPISTINACCSISSGNTVTVANGNTLGLVLIIQVRVP
jgi:hypothetical protein